MLRCVKFYASFYVKIIDIEKGGYVIFLYILRWKGVLMLTACLIILALGMVISITCVIFFGVDVGDTKNNLIKEQKHINAVTYSAIVSFIALFIAYTLVCFVNPNNIINFGDFIIILLSNIPFLFVFFTVFASLRSCFVFLGLGCGILIILVICKIPLILPIGLSMLFGFAICLLLLSLTARKQYQFKENIRYIEENITLDSLEVILGTKPANWEQDEDKLIIIYEKTQWRGFLRGGTIVRSVKVTLIDEKVVKVTTKNLDVPVW